VLTTLTILTYYYITTLPLTGLSRLSGFLGFAPAIRDINFLIS